VPSPSEQYGRFYHEPAHQSRGTASLPFQRSESLHGLIGSAVAAVGKIDPKSPPASNPCALQPDTLVFLGELLAKTLPKVIVEFGSGTSTVCFSRWANDHGSRLISIEHDRRWFEEIQTRLTDQERAATDLRHAPLRLVQSGLRTFLTYGRMDRIVDHLRSAQLILVDGPHISGREAVLYAVLSSCSPGAIVILDDYKHYAVREMLISVASQVADCFVGEAIEQNSHGLYVLRCERTPVPTTPPRLGAFPTLRSYWRCFREFWQYGTGDRSRSGRRAR
jgi:predicted O-methyltransferase YrrM